MNSKSDRIVRAASFADDAQSQVELGNYAGGEAMYRIALDSLDSTDSDHPLTANISFGLASLLHKQGRAHEAEPLYRRTLAIRQNGSGHDDEELVEILDGLGMSQASQGRHEEAYPLLTQALEAAVPESLQEAVVLHHHALVLGKLGRVDDADSCIGRALEIYKRIWGAADPRVEAALELKTALNEMRAP